MIINIRLTSPGTQEEIIRIAVGLILCFCYSSVSLILTELCMHCESRMMARCDIVNGAV
ncbi:hypothetical protein Enr17x_03180 [Gimesia fumaroli]|uniref:Uncharacterized protein n=1 Tax=Gimesia fumaroli TaxID=2527976 RepID=A0A518I5F3_9PLAN|nr:hypothetical protein Enr17x_03180 [Gimesia fumaroli]